MLHVVNALSFTVYVMFLHPINTYALISSNNVSRC